MRNYMTTIRVEDSYSSLYALKEDSFIKISNGEDGGWRKEKLFKLDPFKKNLIENFMLARENMILLAKGTMDANGKSTLSDPRTGRPIRIGDGIIPQIEKYASKASVNRITINTLRTIVNDLSSKADKPQGNNFTFVCNEAFFNEIQDVLDTYLANRKTDGSHLWSKGNDKYIKVGATFDSYEFAGNIVSFKVDRTLSREYPNELYACAIDLTTGTTSKRPPIELWTLKGKSFVMNEILGVGGKTGGEGGIVSSPVAGSMAVIHG